MKIWREKETGGGYFYSSFNNFGEVTLLLDPKEKRILWLIADGRNTKEKFFPKAKKDLYLSKNDKLRKRNPLSYIL